MIIIENMILVQRTTELHSLKTMADVESRSETTPLRSDIDPSNNQSGKKSIQNLNVFSIGIIALFLIVGSLAYSTRSAEVPSTFSLLSSDEVEEHKVQKEVMLFGDSLIGVPTHEYDMGEKLEKELEDAESDYDTVISVSFGNGNTAFELYDRVEDDVLNRDDVDEPPDAVVMLFDTDAADEPDGGKDEYKEKYKKKLSSLLQKLKAKVKYVALAGPILKGEYKDNDIDPKLDDYEDMNKRIARSHGVDYIPLRDMFQDAEDGYDQKAGHLTIDGQHPTKKGAAIIQKAFKDQILSWDGLYSGPTTTTEASNFKVSLPMEKLIASLKAGASYSTCIEDKGEVGCEEQATVMEAAKQEYAKIVGGNSHDLEQKLSVVINNV